MDKQIILQWIIDTVIIGLFAWIRIIISKNSKVAKENNVMTKEINKAVNNKEDGEHTLREYVKEIHTDTKEGKAEAKAEIKALSDKLGSVSERLAAAEAEIKVLLNNKK